MFAIHLVKSRLFIVTTFRQQGTATGQLFRQVNSISTDPVTTNGAGRVAGQHTLSSFTG